jgi:hypothetical protein
MDIDALCWRETDATRLNAVVNDPAVRPFVDELGAGVLDLSVQVANPANVLLMGEHGGCLFFGIGPGVMEVHTVALKSGRGAWVRDFVRAVVHWMFTRTGAYEIVTRIPSRHFGAIRAAEWAGMRYEYRLSEAVRFCGKVDDILVYALRVQDWVLRAPLIEDVGREFHDGLTAWAKTQGIAERPHGDLPAHNRFVGAALEMVRSGQAVKGVLLYNLSAAVMRKPRVTLMFPVGEVPEIMIDIGLIRVYRNGVAFLREARDVAA